MTMPSDISAIEPEELLAQRAWVERLALRLVRDAELARDVAQEAWLVALERPPRHATRGRSLRAWLARVTRSLARDIPRRNGRRAQREQRVAREQEGHALAPSTLDVVTRGAMQQRVAQAVLELDEPYRSAVLLRYLDGLDGSEIAARQGVTPATARKHVSRGLERLRERLSGELEEHGGLAGLFVLLPARPPVAAAPTALSIGSLVAMSVTTKLCLTLISAAAALGLALRLTATSEPGPASVSERDEDQLAPAGSSSPLAVGEEAGVAAPSPERAAALSGAASAAPSELAAAGTSSLTLRARVLDERGWPLQDASLAVFTTDDALGPQAPVGADGRVELLLEEPLPLRSDTFGAADDPPFLVVRASAPGRTAHRWFPAAGDARELDLGEVRLLPISGITGRVVDARGVGQAEVTVQAVHPSPDPERREELELFGPSRLFGPPVVRSDDEGWFELEGLEPGRYRLWAGEQGMLHAHSRILEVGDEPLTEPIELVLRPLPAGRRIDGRVVDAEGVGVAEMPVLAARVSAGAERASFDYAGSTKADGSFTLPVRAGDVLHLRAEPHSGNPISRTERDVPAGSAGVVLRVAQARTLELIVSDAEGQAVASPRVKVQRVDEENINYASQRRDGPDGRVVFSLPESAFTLEVSARGLLPLELGPFDPMSVGAELRCTLETPSRVRGRVHAGGRPVAGAIVQLVRTRSSGKIDEIQGFPTRWDGTQLQGLQVDAEGLFELSILLDHEYYLYADAEGYAAAELGPIELQSFRDRELEIELTPGGGIEGRVVVPEGESAAGISVLLARGDGRVKLARTDEHGDYRLEGLTPGPWMARASRVRREQPRGVVGSLVETRLVHDEYDLPWDCEVFEGQMTQYDIDLESLEVGELSLRVTIDGLPVHGLELHVVGPEDPWDSALGVTPLGRTDLDGAAQLEGLEVGEHQLVVLADSGALRGTRVVLPVDLYRGANEVALNLTTAPLEVRLDERPPGELRLLTRLPGGGVALREVEVPAGVTTMLPAVPRGVVELLVAPTGARRSDPLAWEPVANWSTE